MAEWTRVFTAWSEAEAILAKGLLESEGIPCQVKSSAVAQLPVTVNGLAEINLYVPPEEYTHARELLSRTSSSGSNG